MNQTVVISLGSGSLTQGFPYVTARLWTQRGTQGWVQSASQTQAPQLAHSPVGQYTGSLAPAPALIETHRLWQSTYGALSNRLMLRQTAALGEEKGVGTLISAENDPEDELEIEPAGITNVSQQGFESYSQQLKRQMNDWLSNSALWKIERQLRSHLSPTDEIRVIFETDDALARRLPWHCWQFFTDYPKAEMALSRPNYQQPVQVDRVSAAGENARYFRRCERD